MKDILSASLRSGLSSGLVVLFVVMCIYGLGQVWRKANANPQTFSQAVRL
jgi:hypothetical protein